MSASKSTQNQIVVLAVVLGGFFLVCVGITVGVIYLGAGPGYGTGHKPYDDPKKRFTVEGPANYVFTIKHDSQNSLQKDIHEALGSGQIGEFTIIVFYDFDKLFRPGTSDQEIMDKAADQMRTGFEGQEISKESVDRKSGKADRHLISGKERGKNIIVVLEQYMDGDDLVMLGEVGPDREMVKDEQGKHFFESFAIAHPKIRETTTYDPPAFTVPPPEHKSVEEHIRELEADD